MIGDNGGFLSYIDLQEHCSMISEYNDDKTLKFLNTMRALDIHVHVRSGVVDWGEGESYSNPGRVDTLTIKINLIMY